MVGAVVKLLVAYGKSKPRTPSAHREFGTISITPGKKINLKLRGITGHGYPMLEPMSKKEANILASALLRVARELE